MQHRIRNLFRELRNRSVIRALIAYAVIAWILLHAPEWRFFIGTQSGYRYP